MAAPPPSSRLQTMLQAAVQSVQWTYSLFWHICPQQGILVWGDGYYNGAIKTRKTVQPVEVSAEEASLQRSQQLRELYDSLSAGETNQPAKRPSAALSPEDLTESEWFYLMCVSFSFPPGVGLPGKAYARRQHVWLTAANEVDSKTFSRAILAKSARIQTVVCIPLMDGVVELGTTDKVQEDLSFIRHVKTFFSGHGHLPQPPKPALSEHSTSNPATSSSEQHHHTHFHSPPVPTTTYATALDPPASGDQDDEADNDDDNDEEEEEDEADQSDSEAETARVVRLSDQGGVAGGSTIDPTVVEPSELMQLEMSEDIRLGSPDDGSNNLDSDFNLLAVTQSAGVNPGVNLHQHRGSSYRAESSRQWAPLSQDHPLTGGIQPPPTGVDHLPLDELTQEDNYTRTVSSVLQNQPTRLPGTSSSTNPPAYVTYSIQSAFSQWTTTTNNRLLLHVPPTDGTSQLRLKYILFTVPFLHSKYRDENSPKPRDGDSTSNRFKKGAPQDELSANHVLAERRRREKLNERFIILRSLVPFVTKMDKASILGDTIEYVKQLRKRIQDLETRNRQTEIDQRTRLTDTQRRNSITSSGNSTDQQPQRSGLTGSDRIRVGSDKRKLRIVEGSGGCAKAKAVEPSSVAASTETSVQVSIIESDALLELQCPYKEGLLLDVMQMLRELRIESTTVQSSLTNGGFVAELRAKVKENVNGKKASIPEVKRVMQQLIPHTDN